MELLEEFEQNGFFTSNIYHIMAKKMILPMHTPIVPSEYKKQMTMSTTERLQQLAGINIANIVSKDATKVPVLEFYPKLLIYQNFKPNDRIVSKFVVKNISNKSVYLNVVFKECPILFIKPVGGELLSRLAPGISATFAVTFIPIVYEDFAHQINFYTEADRYCVPIIGVGPRPIMDLPDEVVCPTTPLKVESTATLSVVNLGATAAGFRLSTKSPFSVYPRFAYMASQETALLKVSFKTMHLGESEGILVLELETEEIFHIKLTGSTHTVTIELEKAIVRFLDTYNTMIRQQVFKITNKSDKLVTYMCMKNENLYKDFDEKLKLAKIFYELKGSESAKSMKLVHYDVLTSEEHERVYTRIFFDEIQTLVADESLQFQDYHFSISPIHGSIWPNKTTELTITFAPKEIGDLKATAYLDIDGLPLRVSLTMQGTSLPPDISLNVECLDMDSVYINKEYRYQIVAVNRGHINGVIQYKGCSPLFGSVITCTPEMHCLRPGDKEVFVVTFLNSSQGPYFEELEFHIRDTDIVRKLYLKGTIVYPTLTFGTPCLDFGDVSIGVPKTLHVEVINESDINVKATVKISSDGPEESAITLEDCEASGLAILSQPQWPREFNIEPSKIELLANSRIMIRITLTANIVRTNRTVLELELDKSDSPPITLPLYFNGMVPEIIPAPEIRLRACFLDCHYNYDIIVSSKGHWGYFGIQPPEENSTLHVELAVTRGIIKPNTTICLPCTIMADVLGLQEYNVRMVLFGLSQPIDICRISAQAVRPIVTCTPISVHWGHVKLLTKSYRTLTLSNDSPVTVYFKAYILNKDNKFDIEVPEGLIEPECETEISVSVYLTDADTYTNKAVIHLEKVKDIYIPLTVVGVGTSVMVGPDRDHIQLGRHFCKLPLHFSVDVKNHGTKLHSLEWVEHFKQPRNKPQAPLFFNLEPRVMKIGGGETVILIISGSPQKASFIRETWYLVGSVEGANKKELLVECEITGEFVDPQMIITPTQIELRYDYGPYSEFYKLTGVLTLQNVSRLPLDVDITIKPPFAIIQRENTYKIPEHEEDLCACVRYDKTDLNVQRMLTELGSHESRKYLDCLTNKPIIRERPEPLDFFQDINKIKLIFNLTNTVQERLEDQEMMRLQIVFDTTKHGNLKSKIYSDLMRIKFKGHKNKDAVRVVGKINFPNLIVLTPKIDFQCILNGNMESKVIKIYNPTNLLVCFSLVWNKYSIIRTKLPELPAISYADIAVSSKFSEMDDSKEISKGSKVSGEETDKISQEKPIEGGDAPQDPEAVTSLQIDSGGVPIEGSIKPPEIVVQKDSKLEALIKRKRMLQKITPMLKIEKDSGFAWAYKFPRYTQHETNINDILMVVPYVGKIEPDETLQIQILFKPKRNINISALLECEVLGGPSEFVSVTGQSSDMIFKLSARSINFKIRSFHESATANLVITNMAQLSLEYCTYLNEPVFENELPALIREVVPPTKVLGAEEETEITIVMRPGVLGYFSRSFLLEIGHMPYIPIEVFGWGVIPQVYFVLPRIGINKFPTELGYTAISNLTTEYLSAVSEFFTKSGTEHLNSPQADRCFEDPDFQEDWHICSAWDGYPSVMDIEMAIERHLVNKHLSAKPDIIKVFSVPGKGTPIQGFSTLPYLVDFGVMITDTSVTCSIDVVNYGPLVVRMHYAKSYSPHIWLNIKLCGKLEPGETSKLEMTFYPTTQDFPENEQNLDYTFCLEVPYGVSIPITVRSLIAVPFLKSNVERVDFGSVRCGDKVITRVPLKNVGKPACVWYATLKMKTPGPNPMQIIQGSGKYEPGEGGWLNISFKPTMEMTYEGMLMFRFHMNPTKIVIPIVGRGIWPQVHVIGPKMSFPPTLPWSDVSEIFFGITNPCPFPVELIVAHVDTQWKEEEEVFQLLNRYYNKPEEILLPSIKPGEGIPSAVQNFVSRFKRNVALGLEQEAAKALAMHRAATAKKTPKSPKDKKQKPEKVVETPPERSIRTEAEVIADAIQQMKEEGVDPLMEAWDDLQTDIEEEKQDKYSKGLLLFVHGSPGEEVQGLELAYTLGMQLNLPTVNFDNAIIDALVRCHCPAKTILMANLNDTYEAVKKAGQKNVTGSEDEYEPSGCHITELDDEFDIIKKKVELYSNNKNAATPRSKTHTADKKRNTPSAGSNANYVPPTIGGILFSVDLIEELLREYFSHEKFNRGFVMDSLTSYIVKQPPMVLTISIRCKDSIWNYHLILCQADFSRWAQAYEEAHLAEELAEEKVTKQLVFTEREIEKIIKDFKNMDADEYESADPDLKTIYIQNEILERRRKYESKYGPMRARPDLKKDKLVGKDALMDMPSEMIKTKTKKDEGAKGKVSPEYISMQNRYNEYYRNVYESLIQIACNWVVETGEIEYPLIGLNGQQMGALAKKPKKKSEANIQQSELIVEDKGFPVTLIMCPCINIKEAVANLFSCDFYSTKLREEELFNILESPVSRKVYTVLLPKSLPTIRYVDSLQWLFLNEPPIRKCECNQITELYLLDDTTQDNVLNILSKWACVCGKKMASSQTSTSEIPSSSMERTEKLGEEEEMFPLPLRAVKSLIEPEHRLVLLPGDLVRLKFIFKPTNEGHFSLKRFVEVAGWPESRTEINVTGICDLPRIDSRPKKMFANFIRKAEEDQVYKLTFLDDIKKFEFGPIFIGKQRIYEEEYTIDLRNASLLTCEIEIEFMAVSDIFIIDKKFVVLEPGGRDKLTISAAPAVIGDHETYLLFCIKDNPEIVKLDILCHGVVPMVEVLPITKIIDYGKLLLYRREDDRFIVKNDSILPIRWNIRNPEDFAANFIISKLSGVVPRNDNQVVPITYTACAVGIINMYPLIIDIYDELGRGDPMVVESMYISAECYDVMVECVFENPREMFLNFGNVKVNSTVYREMYMLNKGKYNIYYKLKKVKNFPDPALLKSFSVVPESGLLPPALRVTAVEFECTPTTKINLDNVPAYTCSLLDSSKEQIVVAKFPVCVTIASFYNTFTLFPLGELNFHIIAVGEGVIRDVILNNTSKCPFNYEIILPEQYRTGDEVLPSQMPAGKDNKLKVPPLKCGNFVIVNDDNLLAPGEKKVIPIEFLATSARRFEETIHFVVSDTCPAEADGVPLKLVGTGALPSLDFWYLENTFREHLIVKSIEEYNIKESTPHCVLAENTVTFHYLCVIVNTSHTANIDLYNNGLVPCVLKNILHYQTNTAPSIFTLSHEDMQIEPFQHKRLAIKFSPKTLMEYRAVLEVRLKMLQDRTESYNLCLLGAGVIPRVQLVTPSVRQPRLGVLNFPLTCLGSMNKKFIRLKNISSVSSVVNLVVIQARRSRPVFWITPGEGTGTAVDFTDVKEYTRLKITIKPEEKTTVRCYFNPLAKGHASCDINIRIRNNPYEYFTVLCEAEAFVEDVILLGLEMLTPPDDEIGSTSFTGSRKQVKSAGDRTKSKELKKGFPQGPGGEVLIPALLQYVLDFGGCELLATQKRSVIMMNNSELLYKFVWTETETVLVKPSVGYISPGEEKDFEILFFASQPCILSKEPLSCNLQAISNESLTLDLNKIATWDCRQSLTVFKENLDCLHERMEVQVEDQPIDEPPIALIDIIILYSAVTEYTKYSCNLKDDLKFPETFIYQKASREFRLRNTGTVPLKVTWKFYLDDEYPARLDKHLQDKKGQEIEIRDVTATSEEPTVSGEAVDTSGASVSNRVEDKSIPHETTERSSKSTLFSGSLGRDSVDTWFEADLPFTIEPDRACLKPGESQIFQIVFSPNEAFQFTVRLKSSIDNLDPYDQNVSCKIIAKSVIPFVHLDIEESDYLSWRKSTGIVLPPFMKVLEFNVLGSGCYKKSFQVINPTNDGYEFLFEYEAPALPENKPSSSKDFNLTHCDKLKGFVEGGTSDTVTFTFAPTSPGIFESQWNFTIPSCKVMIPLMVVGIVREADVSLTPAILTILNSLVGFTHTSVVKIESKENEELQFEYKGNTLYDETGKIPIVVRPQEGALRPNSETEITIYYTPLDDGPVSFKILFQVQHVTKPMTLIVNALSYWVKPKVTYYIIGTEHVLNHEVITNIHLEQTASTYERTVPFKLRNDGSITFHYDWSYVVTPVKKYLTVSVEPREGYIPPGGEVECVLHFHLRMVPVQAYPVTLAISDGPTYKIYLYAEIEKPKYHFNVRDYDFGKCVIGAPDKTYRKNLAFTNDDTVAVLIDLDMSAPCPELFIDYRIDPNVQPQERVKIPIYFRPKKIMNYEFKLLFWVNSLCEEIITIRGEGVPLLIDLYEGCQKTFDLGPVKVGNKIIREIDVMNFSKVPIEAQFIFKTGYEIEKSDDNAFSEGSSICLDPTTPTAVGDFAGPSRVHGVIKYRDEQTQNQIAKDIENALASLKVTPAKCMIQPHRRVTLKILFRPVGLISDLNIQLNAKVLEMIRPLVLLSGSATGMSLRLSQDSLQFGRVRKRGCKVLKVMLENNGDMGARFWWQPLVSEEFKISPMQGHIAAHTNVTFNIRFTPLEYNPFVKVWANCNIENYQCLDLALYGTCVDEGLPQTRSVLIECPVREVFTEFISVTNPTDENWLVLTEQTGAACFETLREFVIAANSTYDIPIHFKPRTMGQHEVEILFSPLGETALFVQVIGVALQPNPTDVLNFTVEAKKTLNVSLACKNITEKPETYELRTELVSLNPENFQGYYEIVYPDKVKCWGEASATCNWSIVCFEPVFMALKVVFIQEETREFQFYEINVDVTPSNIMGCLRFCCAARESVQRQLVVSNPLTQEARFHINCDKLKCDASILIGKRAEAKITMTYCPLVVGEFEDYLSIEHPLIGTYTYRVEAICTPAKPKELEYSTPLGTYIPIRLRVINKSEMQATFYSQVDHPSITADKESYVLEPYEKGKFLVWFEPTELGVKKIQVSFDSSVAGEYKFIIKGKGTEPLPMGPYEIVAGGYNFVKFKNVFTETRVFKVFVDCEEFYVRTMLEEVKSKKEIKVQVFLNDRPSGGWTGKPPTGTLTIEPFEPPDPKVHWTYFLQGK